MSTAIKIEAAASKIAHPKSSNPTIVTSGLDSEGISAPIDGQRTPADEAIFFFETSPTTDAQPVQVYELQLEEDGAPSKDKAVCMLRERILMFPRELTYIASTFDCLHPTFHTCFECPLMQARQPQRMACSKQTSP